MRVTSTAISASAMPALKPAKPPPTTTTRGRGGRFFTEGGRFSAIQALSATVVDEMRWLYDPDRSKRFGLDLGIKVEEGLDALAQLVLDFFPASLEHVHGHVGLFAVLERHQGVAHFYRLLGRKQPHAVNQSQICHAAILLPPLASFGAG